MKRVDTATSVPGPPSYSDGPNPDQIFTNGGAEPGDGTIPGADWCNMLQEELVNAVTIDGAELDTGVDNQLATTIEPAVKSIRADGSDTGVVSSTWTRALLASGFSQASGDESAVVAALQSTATGHRSLVAASHDAEAPGAVAAVIASKGGVVSGVTGATSATLVAASALEDAGSLECTDSHSAIIASRAYDGGSVRATGRESAVIASSLSLNSSQDTVASGAQSAVIASTDSQATGNGCAVIASDDSTAATGGNSAVVASFGSTAPGATASAMASSSADATGDNSAAIASNDVRANADVSAVIASYGLLGDPPTTASGAKSAAVIACTDGVVSGDNVGLGSSNTLVAAATKTGAGVLEATGEQSAVIASSASNESSIRATGPSSVVIATTSDVSPAADAIASGDNSAIIACADEALASGDNAAVIASSNATASGISRSTVIASLSATASGSDSVVLGSAGGSNADALASGDNSAIIASWTDDPDGSIQATNAGAVVLGSRVPADTDGTITAAGVAATMISCREDTRNNGNNSVMLASRECELSYDFTVAGGAIDTADITPDGSGNDELAWRIHSDDWDGGGAGEAGDILIDGTLTTDDAADYAEMFENEAGTIPPGTIIGLDGDRVRPAHPGDMVLGVQSPKPATLAGAASLGWQGRWQRDEWGRIQRVPRTRAKWPELREQHVRWSATDDREAYDGPESEAPTPVPEDATRYESVVRKAHEGWLDQWEHPVPEDAETWERQVRQYNPEYAPGSHSYQSRRQRPDEWTCVGLLGQLRVRVDESVHPNTWVQPSEEPGVGTAADGPPTDGSARIRCMRVLHEYTKKRGYAIAMCLVRS